MPLFPQSRLTAGPQTLLRAPVSVRVLQNSKTQLVDQRRCGTLHERHELGCAAGWDTRVTQAALLQPVSCRFQRCPTLSNAEALTDVRTLQSTQCCGLTQPRKPSQTLDYPSGISNA